MAITYVRDTGLKLADGTGASSASFGSLPTVGNFIIVLAITQSGTPVIAITDNQSGNTYNNDVQQAAGGNGHDFAAIISSKIAVSAGTFTVTMTPQAGAYTAWIAIEVSGLAAASWLDKTGVGSGTTGANVANVTASGANSQNDEFIVAVTAVGGSSASMGFSTPSGYTQVWVSNDATTHDVGEAAYKIISAGETSSAAWNHATAAAGFGWAAVLATYKAAAGGATVTYPQLERGIRGLNRGSWVER